MRFENIRICWLSASFLVKEKKRWRKGWVIRCNECFVYSLYCFLVNLLCYCALDHLLPCIPLHTPSLTHSLSIDSLMVNDVNVSTISYFYIDACVSDPCRYMRWEIETRLRHEKNEWIYFWLFEPGNRSTKQNNTHYEVPTRIYTKSMHIIDAVPVCNLFFFISSS